MGKIRNIHKIQKVKYIPMLLGSLLGSLFFLFFNNSFYDYFSENNMQEYNVTAIMELPFWKLFFYVFRQRAGQILFFILLVLLLSYSIATCLYLFFFGIYYGFVMEQCMILFGVKGIFYCFFCFFPHYLLYFFGLSLFGQCMIEPFIKRKEYSYATINTLQKIIVIVWIVLLFGMGLIWEIKYQKNILNYFYQYIV